MFSAVIVFFLVFFTTRQGVEEVPRDLVSSVRIMGGNRRDIAVRVVLPSALIWVATGLKISVPYALVGVVVGEMLVGNTGLGFLLAQSANRSDKHTSELQSLMRTSYAVFCLKKKTEENNSPRQRCIP